ncbi:hybrid sensor histidine kinase/response regulator [Persicimonas caeni]|uniref:histidine kinase n=1 Tax=Persicimonas caeni TaxID=2292766 RepID=A0A4Y6PZG6_PERCE|nr:hybrid sensor histidine kinase/response regulator [Persicimonas caeni]QDG53714.1 hybrid sensor histidine kinase/response regulator [Persicimonas caeni]QED34935.1 hybrid sensor histidine kinase/response regulator [Persicimonas caeni]
MDMPSTMMTDEQEESLRVLFLPENPHDVTTAEKIFGDADIDLAPCSSLTEVLCKLDQGAGVILATEEQLLDEELDRLVERLEAQPAWSDLPLLVITRSGKPYPVSQRLAEAGNVSFIERPIHFKPLVSIVRAALRDRQRQYAIRRSLANRDRFLAMLGHELRNPLAAIIFGVDQLETDADGSAREIIRRQSANLERIVDDLLDVSRISRGALSFDKERVDLAQLTRETVSAFENIAADEGVEMTLEVEDDAPHWVYGDAVRLEQMFGNLLKNAVRYTPEHGRVDVSVSREADEVVVRVTDNGIGIPEEMLQNIFELFSQAHVDFSRREGGLGLGLSLAHSIVESHGGDIVARSDGKGEGSVFEVRLPAEETTASQGPEGGSEAHEPERPDDQAPSKDERAEGLRLLVVEDVDDVREPFCEMLRLRGYEADEAATGQAGIDAAHEHSYDVVLLDIGLPDLDGFEVAQTMRADGYEGLLVALTGYSSEEDRQRADAAGFDTLLTKPVSFHKLEEAIATVQTGWSSPPS